MRITTHKSAKALKWVRIKAAFYSKGLFFPIVNLLTALQDSVYGSTGQLNHLEIKKIITGEALQDQLFKTNYSKIPADH